MNILEFKAEYQTLTNYGEFDTMRNRDAKLTSIIKELYQMYFGVMTRTCSNCWYDAYMRLMGLKQTTIAKMKNLEFEVKAGTFVYDPVALDSRYVLTPANLFNLGNDLALRHIIHAKVADVNKYFSKKPSDESLEELIAEYKKREAKSADISSESKTAE